MRRAVPCPFLLVCWVYGRDGRVLLGQRLDRKLECRKLGLGRQSKVLPEAMFEEDGFHELGKDQGT